MMKTLYRDSITALDRGLKLKFLRGPNEDLQSNSRGALSRWHNNGGTWTLL